MAEKSSQRPLLMSVDSPRPPAGRNAFLIVKRQVLASASKLKASERLVALALADHMRIGEDGRLIAWPGRKRIAEETALSDRCVGAALSALVKRHGLFAEAKVPGRENAPGRPSCAYVLVEELSATVAGNSGAFPATVAVYSRGEFPAKGEVVSGKSRLRYKEGTAVEPLTDPTPIPPPHGAGAERITPAQAARAADRIAARWYELTGARIADEDRRCRGWAKKIRRGSAEADLMAAVEAVALETMDRAQRQEAANDAHRVFIEWLRVEGGGELVVPKLADWVAATIAGDPSKRPIDMVGEAAVALGAPAAVRRIVAAPINVTWYLELVAKLIASQQAPALVQENPFPGAEEVDA